MTGEPVPPSCHAPRCSLHLPFPAAARSLGVILESGFRARGMDAVSAFPSRRFRWQDPQPPGRCLYFSVGGQGGVRRSLKPPPWVVLAGSSYPLSAQGASTLAGGRACPFLLGPPLSSGRPPPPLSGARALAIAPCSHQSLPLSPGQKQTSCPHPHTTPGWARRSHSGRVPSCAAFRWVQPRRCVFRGQHSSCTHTRARMPWGLPAHSFAPTDPACVTRGSRPPGLHPHGQRSRRGGCDLGIPAGCPPQLVLIQRGRCTGVAHRGGTCLEWGTDWGHNSGFFSLCWWLFSRVLSAVLRRRGHAHTADRHPLPSVCGPRRPHLKWMVPAALPGRRVHRGKHRPVSRGCRGFRPGTAAQALGPHGSRARLRPSPSPCLQPTTRAR